MPTNIAKAARNYNLKDKRDRAEFFHAHPIAKKAVDNHVCEITKGGRLVPKKLR